jgi:hypothetical protein
MTEDSSWIGGVRSSDTEPRDPWLFQDAEKALYRLVDPAQHECRDVLAIIRALEAGAMAYFAAARNRDKGDDT